MLIYNNLQMKKLFYIATIASLLFSCKQEVEEEKIVDDGLITVTEAQFQSSKIYRVEDAER